MVGFSLGNPGFTGLFAVSGLPVVFTGSFNEPFEFAGGWDETVASIPSPTFASVSLNEPFEFAGSWDETVASIPSPTFASADFDEDFDSSWDGT